VLIPFSDLVPKYNMNITGILHLGAHMGQESQAYEELGIKNVVWVEADRGVHRKLAKAMPEYNKCICAVVGENDGDTVTFNKANNEQSSSILDLMIHRRYHPDVEFVKSENRKTTTVDTIMSKVALDINMLNIDLQGAELLALKGAEKTLEQIDYIYTEVNQKELYRGCVQLPDLDAWLDNRGFTRVDTLMTQCFWGDALYVRSSLL